VAGRGGAPPRRASNAAAAAPHSAHTGPAALAAGRRPSAPPARSTHPRWLPPHRAPEPTPAAPGELRVSSGGGRRRAVGAGRSAARSGARPAAEWRRGGGAAGRRGGEAARRRGGAQQDTKTCPTSTEGWTRRVHFVREGGRGGAHLIDRLGRAAVPHAALRPPVAALDARVRAIPLEDLRRPAVILHARPGGQPYAPRGTGAQPRPPPPRVFGETCWGT